MSEIGNPFLVNEAEFFGADLDEYKLKFAIATINESIDAFDAALDAFGMENAAKAMYASKHWKNSKEIKKLQEQYVKQVGERSFMPSKEAIAIEILRLARWSAERIDFEASHKFYKLYGDYMGHIEKPNSVINTNVAVDNRKVMIVHEQKSNDDWEEITAKQQRQLIDATIN